MAQNARARAKITVKYDQKNIKKVQKELNEELEQTGDDFLKDLIDSQMVPYDTGSLQRSIIVDKSSSSKGKISIVATSPKAKSIYFDPDIKISRKINKNARAHFFGSYIRGNKKEVFMDLFEKNYKNKNGKMVKK